MLSEVKNDKYWDELIDLDLEELKQRSARKTYAASLQDLMNKLSDRIGVLALHERSNNSRLSNVEVKRQSMLC